tara:strand:- start:98 stop:1447 length:1350 start_codon:yes stop_codon:yes gene_type:complete
MKFLIKIFSPVCLGISFFLLIYTFYRSEIIWSSNKDNYYFDYYVLSFLLFSFSIFTFFLKYKLKEYVVIFTISFVFSIYLFEFYLVKNSKDKNENLEKNLDQSEMLTKEKIYYESTGKKWDKRNKYTVFNDLKTINKNIKTEVSPFYHLYGSHPIFPLSGISNSETLYCNENGYYSIYNSDKYGFNNPNEEWDNKEILFMLVGDSFTQGACVNRPNDIGSVLRNLSNKSVLNLGYGGNGPLIQYATLREYLSSNVKKVLWIYYEGNDLKNLKRELKDEKLINYLNDLSFSQNLKTRQNEIDTIANKTIKIELERKKKVEKNFKTKLIEFLKLRKTRNLIYSLGQIKENPFLEFKKILILSNNLAIKNNSKFYFVYLPEYKRYKTNYDNTHYNLIKKTVDELNIPFVDIHEQLFLRIENPLSLFPFELGGHYNIYGYKKVSETIYKSTKN